MGRTNVLLPITDPRMMSLVCTCGAEGYAVYTSFLMLSEDSPSIPLGPVHIKTLSQLLQMDCDKTESILDTLASPALGSLVVKTGEGYLSAQLIKAESRSEKRRQAASKRWNKHPEEEAETVQDDNLQCTFAMQNVDANCNANVQNQDKSEQETSKSLQLCEENVTQPNEPTKESPKEKRTKKEIPNILIHPSIQGLVLSSAGGHAHTHVEDNPRQDSEPNVDSKLPDGRTDGLSVPQEKQNGKKPVKLADRVIISDKGYAKLLDAYPEEAIREAAQRLDDGLASGKLKPSSSTFKRLEAFLEGMDRRGEIYRADPSEDVHQSSSHAILVNCPTCGGKLTPGGVCHNCRTIWSRAADGYSPSPMADDDEIGRRIDQLEDLLRKHPVRRAAN